MRNTFLSCIILLGFICGISAQEPQDQQERQSLRDQEETDSNYIISEEDVLSITVRNEPEYSVTGRSVRMDGRITLPMLGEMHVSGRTTKQLEADLTERLKYHVREPIVQVFVDKVFSHRVTVAGKINRPGLHAITSPSTVLEVITRAGGPTATAKVKKIKIVRYVDGKEVQFLFNYKDVIRGKNLHQNILLENRDLILIP